MVRKGGCCAGMGGRRQAPAPDPFQRPLSQLPVALWLFRATVRCHLNAARPDPTPKDRAGPCVTHQRQTLPVALFAYQPSWAPLHTLLLFPLLSSLRATAHCLSVSLQPKHQHTTTAFAAAASGASTTASAPVTPALSLSLSPRARAFAVTKCRAPCAISTPVHRPGGNSRACRTACVVFGVAIAIWWVQSVRAEWRERPWRERAAR